MEMIQQAIVFLIAAVVIVPLFKKFGLGSVLGYLFAGACIGPWGFGLVTEVSDVLHFAELGVVLLLFIIGLELQPTRLWLLRKSIIFMGGAQFLATTLVILPIAIAFMPNWQSALVVSMCLSLSSTAFAIQLLSEKKNLFSQHGRNAFSILLFQDLIVIPILVLLPLLSHQNDLSSETSLLQVLKAIATVTIVIVAGHYLIRPLLRLVAWSKNPELFSAASLLVALGTAALMYKVGLSMALGAFLAGVLLADSEFKHELEANIEPFKGLLLGLFFMSVGMSVDMHLALSKPILIISLALALLTIKASILFSIAKTTKQSNASAIRLAAIISQGGEFAFIILIQAVGLSIVDSTAQNIIVITVTLSMALTPPLYAISEVLYKKWTNTKSAPQFDTIEDDEPRVIISGFGRFGQIIARILSIKKIRFTALESNFEQVDMVRKFGNKVYFGDSTRLNVLRAAGAESAEVFILSIVNQESSIKTAAAVKKHFPHLKIFARARNRQHAYQLMDIGVDYVIRETFFSAVELSRKLLLSMNINTEEAEKVTQEFQAYDEELVLKQHAIQHDEKQLVASAKQAAEELQNLFEEDSGSKINVSNHSKT